MDFEAAIKCVCVCVLADGASTPTGRLRLRRRRAAPDQGSQGSRSEHRRRPADAQRLFNSPVREGRAANLRQSTGRHLDGLFNNPGPSACRDGAADAEQNTD